MITLKKFWESRRTFVTLASLVMAAAALVLVSDVRSRVSSQRELTLWNIYRGEYAGYNVEIDEAAYSDNSYQRIVHLIPIDNEGKGFGYRSITGHNYRDIWQKSATWDRMFLCGYPTDNNGCNAVRFHRAGGARTWEPCPADSGKLEPFGDEVVASSLVKLDAAMSAIYNPAHRVSTLEQGRQKHPVVNKRQTSS